MKKHRIIRFVLFTVFSALVTLTLQACDGGGGGGGSGGSGKPEASATIGASGGTVEVTNAASPLYGVKVEIPAGALSNSTTISISKETVLPPTSELSLLSSIIKLEPTGTQFNSPIKITLPYNKSGLAANDLISPFVYSETQSYWYFPIVRNVDQTTGQVEILTTHFSDHAVAKFSGPTTPPDTGFIPNMNGFKISNTQDTCSGMAGFAQWYYVNHSECNSLFSIDEQTASQIVGLAQTLTKETKQWNWQDFKNKTRGILPWSWFISAVQHEMVETNSPVIIAKITQHEGSDPTGHASLAYRFDATGVLAYDPSNPGTERIITENEYNDPNSDYIVWHTSELYNSADFESIFEKYKTILCKACQDVSGSWLVNETATITCSGSFGSGTQTQSGSGNVTITQNGCNISFLSPANATRSGTVTGNNIQFSGIVAQTSGVDINQNNINFTGTINQSVNTINTTGTGAVTGSVSGVPGSCTVSSTETFTR